MAAIVTFTAAKRDLGWEVLAPGGSHEPRRRHPFRRGRPETPDRIGQMLGPYQILSKAGEGGMGEVYKARDTRLDRTVARHAR